MYRTGQIERGLGYVTIIQTDLTSISTITYTPDDGRVVATLIDPMFGPDIIRLESILAGDGSPYMVQRTLDDSGAGTRYDLLDVDYNTLATFKQVNMGI